MSFESQVANEHWKVHFWAAETQSALSPVRRVARAAAPLLFRLVEQVAASEG